MIRPCDTCGGSGDPNPPCDDPVCAADHADSCPTCVDMPRLKTKHAMGSGNNPLWMRGWFKPDPSTVARWCFHYSEPTTIVDGKDWHENGIGCNGKHGWVPAITEADMMEEA